MVLSQGKTPILPGLMFKLLEGPLNDGEGRIELVKR